MKRNTIINRRQKIDWPDAKKYEEESEEDEEVIVNRKRKERNFEQIRKKSSKRISWTPITALPLDTVSHGIMPFLETPNLVRFGSTSRYFQECFLKSLPILQLHSIPMVLRATTANLYAICNGNHPDLMRAHYLRRKPRYYSHHQESQHVCTGIYWSVQYGFRNTADDFYNHQIGCSLRSIPEFDEKRLTSAILGAISGGHQDTITWLETKFDPEFTVGHGFQFLFTSCEKGTLALVKWAYGIWRRFTFGWGPDVSWIHMAMRMAASNKNKGIMAWLYEDPDQVHHKHHSTGLPPGQFERDLNLAGEFGKELLKKAKDTDSKDALEWLGKTIEKLSK